MQNSIATFSPDTHALPFSLREFITEKSVIVRSPGRINLIGEHTDYNGGFVLPAAINKAVYMVINERDDNNIHLTAVDLHENYITDVTSIKESAESSWPNYVLGVVDQFLKAGAALKGFDIAFTADIPIGAGLSSSAAVECATAMALNETFSVGFDKLTMVKLSQRAENEYVGVQCGIMDQFASMFGKKNHVIKLDCRSLEYDYEPFSMSGFKVVLFDTGVKHSLGSSEYNVRRQQCEKGVALIQQYLPEVKSLRDATLAMLDEYVLTEDVHVYIRCRYVVEEIQRLLAACVDLEANDMDSFGKKMYETHFGLSKLYEVSCDELDYLVEHVQHNPHVLGARMMGGGFGGCTINLVEKEAVNQLIEETSTAYRNAMKLELKAYVVSIEDGTSVLK